MCKKEHLAKLVVKCKKNNEEKNQITHGIDNVDSYVVVINMNFMFFKTSTLLYCIAYREHFRGTILDVSRR